MGLTHYQEEEEGEWVSVCNTELNGLSMCVSYLPGALTFCDSLHRHENPALYGAPIPGLQSAE